MGSLVPFLGEEFFFNSSYILKQFYRQNIAYIMSLFFVNKITVYDYLSKIIVNYILYIYLFRYH
jgi:hypothetical protein